LLCDEDIDRFIPFSHKPFFTTSTISHTPPQLSFFKSLHPPLSLFIIFTNISIHTSRNPSLHPIESILSFHTS
ncbi:hypothetical protein, partial [Bacillus pumilus]|uniref:hypothetical protein n=1 Tax=Bacillus pumilus TaxID=1408 RepID=UPI001C92F785